MVISKEKKNAYIEDVYSEMKRRGFTSDEIETVIGKTGFMDALDKYPEEQLHYDVSDAVDEIIMTAARN
jgi:hypothetical protein